MSEVEAVTKCYDIIKWLFPQLDRFPRTFKFIVGDRLAKKLLDILDLLIDASYSREKKDQLRQANLGLEQARHLVRLAKDLRFLTIKKYEHLSREMNDLGRQIGGWSKASKA
jgi:hypothetical protein